MVLTIIDQEKLRRRDAGESADHSEVDESKPTLKQLQQLLHQPTDRNRGTLPKEDALMSLGYFRALVAWNQLSCEDYLTLVNSLPDYPDDPDVQRMLHPE